MTQRGVNWSDNETLNLIDIWGNEEIQTDLENSIRNWHVYEYIRLKLSERGIQRSVVQVKERMKTLKKIYKRGYDYNSKSGRKTCRFFDKLDEVLGNRPPSIPMMLLDNPMSTEVKIEQYSADEHLLNDNDNVPEVKCISDADAEDLAMSCIAIEETSPSSRSPTPLHTNQLQTSPIGQLSGKQKRKPTAMEQTLSQMIETFMDKQLELQNAFFEQEEKRIKLESELEDKRRQEERQHEILMLQMILGKCTDPQMAEIITPPASTSTATSSTSSTSSSSSSTSKIQTPCSFS
ncbi:uncharacterized protein LOC106871749 isoform X2 [Octopus bimaculoides]|uniref:Uncharacterized protein LOC115231013 isoform X2 n=1 Tax=Octopus sinensis TaxID=2607531 RepID=A0A6P7U7I8_9MOLL|nr:uncharacterized protein LOC106871749 isoform X2 [Octopus bimaculoides]XP_029656966.1 uncharacterized protein LOC115231013 isoform X2 [Octopus sinensis]|eukprot:XP_014773862.1 PREDICTED: uncharacterized protein LOC106871749 isoform X2 [Octopus bimaculoides]